MNREQGPHAMGMRPGAIAACRRQWRLMREDKLMEAAA